MITKKNDAEKSKKDHLIDKKMSDLTPKKDPKGGKKPGEKSCGGKQGGKSCGGDKGCGGGSK